MNRSEADRAYMEGQQQIFLAAKVNRLCEVASKEEFDADNLIPAAQDIVQALDPRLAFTSAPLLRFMDRIGKGRKTFVAATELGNVSASFEDRNKPQAQTEEYRIGLYVARKQKRIFGLISMITFEHYLARSGVRGPLENFPQVTAIAYHRETLDLLTIRTFTLQPKMLGSLFYIKRQPGELLWQQDKAYRDRRRFERDTQV